MTKRHDRPCPDEEPQEADLAELEDQTSDTLPCPECGQEVYDDTVRCPHCGNYITTSVGRSHRGWWKWLVVAIIAASMLAWLATC